MAEVFVSYANNDRDAARRIVDAIRQTGLDVWGPDQVQSGVDFSEQIELALEGSRCVVVLWSREAAKSEWLQREIRHAIKGWSSDRLVLGVLDDAPLPVGLRDIQATSMRGEESVFEHELIERVRATVARAEAKIAVEYAKRSEKSRSAMGRPAMGLLVAAMVFAITVMVAQRGYPLVEEHAGLLILIFLGVVGAVVALILKLLQLFWLYARGAWSARSFPTSPASTPATSIGSPPLFVSYSRQDGPAVDQLIQQFEQLGYGVWIDRNATGPQRYAGKIVHAIRMSKIVTLMWSQHAFESDHVIREIYIAGDYKKPFIIFQLDSTGFPDEVLYFVSGFPRISIAAVNRQQLCSEIERVLAI
ncbi:MAG: toll/interleukin-1 receptor domain-containing protein [Methylocystis sp.]